MSGMVKHLPSARTYEAGTQKDFIVKMNHTHDFMIDWMIQNPGMPLRALAEALAINQSWVSRVVHSDMFQAAYQARMKELRGDYFDMRQAAITAGAIETVEAIREKVAANPTERFLIDAAKTLLPAAGYSAPAVPKNAEPQKHLHVHVDAATLEASRERMRARFGTVVEPEQSVDPVEAVAVPLAAETEFEIEAQMSLFDSEDAA